LREEQARLKLEKEMKNKEESKAAPVSNQNVEDLIEGTKRHRTLLDQSKADPPQSDPSAGMRPKPSHELRISTFVGEITIVSTRKEKLTQETQCDLEESDEEMEEERVDTRHKQE
jgi:hypothetical protein